LSAIAEAVRAIAVCPRYDCRAGIGLRCIVRSGRNHTERVHAALREALALEAEDRGFTADEIVEMKLRPTHEQAVHWSLHADFRDK
jgi:hypothetical protein